MRMIIPRRGTAAAAAVRTAVDVAVGAAVRVAEVDAVVVVEEEAVADAAVEEGRERGFLRSGRPPARSFVVRKSPFFFPIILQSLALHIRFALLPLVLAPAPHARTACP